MYLYKSNYTSTFPSIVLDNWTTEMRIIASFTNHTANRDRGSLQTCSAHIAHICVNKKKGLYSL